MNTNFIITLFLLFIAAALIFYNDQHRPKY